MEYGSALTRREMKLGDGFRKSVWISRLIFWPAWVGSTKADKRVAEADEVDDDDDDIRLFCTAKQK